VASTTTTRKSKHTAKGLLSPEVPLDAETLVIEASRALKRIRKNPLLGREAMLAEIAPTEARIHKLAEALEAKRERPVKVVREVVERIPVDPNDPMDGHDFADVDGEEAAS
jgi:hypothetical protein